jgi:glycosyltransferase involved in cell wall biosynthesis
MKVVHLMRTYGPHGGEQQLSQLFGANRCAQIEEIFVFVLRDPDCAALFVQCAPQLAQLSLWPRSQPTGSAWYEFLRLVPRLPLLQWRFWRLLGRLGSEVCVVHGFQAALVAWPAACLRRRIGWAYVHRTTKESSRFGLIFRGLYRPFQVVAGNSRAVMRSLAPYARPDQLVALDNGIDLEKFDCHRQEPLTLAVPQAQGPVLIAVGRLLPSKGQELVVDALALLLPDHPRLMLWIVGEGGARKSLERRMAAQGLQAHVALLGQRSDVPALLRRATVFVNASALEGMSNAVLEGMAAGLPSVVADAPGVSECHVPDVTGLVVNRDPQSLARGVAQLLADPARAQVMGLEARRRVEAVYSIEANRQRYDALYERLKKG